MLFRGLFAFVPNDEKGSMTALVLDARKPGHSSVDSNSRHFPHIATLLFDSSNLVCPPSPTSNPRFDHVCNGQIVWPLDGDDLRIIVNGQDYDLSPVTRTLNFNSMTPFMK